MSNYYPKIIDGYQLYFLPPNVDSYELPAIISAQKEATKIPITIPSISHYLNDRYISEKRYKALSSNDKLLVKDYVFERNDFPIDIEINHKHEYIGVMIKDGFLASFCRFSIEKPGLMVLDFVGVHPKHRGLKLCPIILTYCLQIIKNLEIKTIYLLNIAGLTGYLCYKQATDTTDYTFLSISNDKNGIPEHIFLTTEKQNNILQYMTGMVDSYPVLINNTEYTLISSTGAAEIYNLDKNSYVGIIPEVQYLLNFTVVTSGLRIAAFKTIDYEGNTNYYIAPMIVK